MKALSAKSETTTEMIGDSSASSDNKTTEGPANSPKPSSQSQGVHLFVYLFAYSEDVAIVKGGFGHHHSDGWSDAPDLDRRSLITNDRLARRNGPRIDGLP